MLFMYLYFGFECKKRFPNIIYYNLGVDNNVICYTLFHMRRLRNNLLCSYFVNFYFIVKSTNVVVYERGPSLLMCGTTCQVLSRVLEDDRYGWSCFTNSILTRYGLDKG